MEVDEDEKDEKENIEKLFKIEDKNAEDQKEPLVNNEEVEIKQPESISNEVEVKKEDTEVCIQKYYNEEDGFLSDIDWDFLSTDSVLGDYNKPKVSVTVSFKDLTINECYFYVIPKSND